MTRIFTFASLVAISALAVSCSEATDGATPETAAVDTAAKTEAAPTKAASASIDLENCGGVYAAFLTAESSKGASKLPSRIWMTRWRPNLLASLKKKPSLQKKEKSLTTTNSRTSGIPLRNPYRNNN